MQLIDFAREVVGDRHWTPSPADLSSLAPLDWRGPDREAAITLLRWCYWEPRVAPAERGFYPGGVSRAGFLDWGEDLATTIEEDQEVVRVLGTDCRRVGARLKSALDAAQASDADCASSSVEQSAGVVVGNLEVQVRAFRGFQRCPFTGCVHAQPRQPAPHSSVDFQLIRRSDQADLRGPGIAWHLIAAHGFFGGRGGACRVDPARAVAILGQED